MKLNEKIQALTAAIAVAVLCSAPESRAAGPDDISPRSEPPKESSPPGPSAPRLDFGAEPGASVPSGLKPAVASALLPTELSTLEGMWVLIQNPHKLIAENYRFYEDQLKREGRSPTDIARRFRNTVGSLIHVVLEKRPVVANILRKNQAPGVDGRQIILDRITDATSARLAAAFIATDDPFGFSFEEIARNMDLVTSHGKPFLNDLAALYIASEPSWFEVTENLAAIQGLAVPAAVETFSKLLLQRFDAKNWHFKPKNAILRAVAPPCKVLATPAQPSS